MSPRPRARHSGAEPLERATAPCQRVAELVNHGPVPRTRPPGCVLAQRCSGVASRSAGRQADRGSRIRHAAERRWPACPRRASRRSSAPSHNAARGSPTALGQRTDTRGSRAPPARSTRHPADRSPPSHSPAGCRRVRARRAPRGYRGRPHARGAHDRARRDGRHGRRNSASLDLAAKRSQTGLKKPKQKFCERLAA